MGTTACSNHAQLVDVAVPLHNLRHDEALLVHHSRRLGALLVREHLHARPLR